VGLGSRRRCGQSQARHFHALFATQLKPFSCRPSFCGAAERDLNWSRDFSRRASFLTQAIRLDTTESVTLDFVRFTEAAKVPVVNVHVKHI
jgi:hypothetical protein